MDAERHLLASFLLRSQQRLQGNHACTCRIIPLYVRSSHAGPILRRSCREPAGLADASGSLALADAICRSDPAMHNSERRAAARQHERRDASDPQGCAIERRALAQLFPACDCSLIAIPLERLQEQCFSAGEVLLLQR